MNRKIQSLGLFICMLGALFYCYEYFLRIAPSVVTAEIRNLYHIDATIFGYLMAFYYWAYTPMQLPVGVLMDRYGPRRLLTLASLVCGVGVLLFINPTHQLHLAKIGRFFIGFGSAFAFVGALKLAAVWLPANRFAMFAGIVTTLGMLGAMTGDIVLVRVFEHYDWETIFILSGWIGIGLAIVIYMVVRDKKPREDGPVQYYVPPRIRRASLAHITVEFVKLLNNRQVWFNGLIGCFLFMSLSAFAELWGMEYFRVGFNLSKTEAANATAMVFLGWAVGGPVMGWLSDYFQRRKLFLLLGASISTLLMFSVLTVDAISYQELCILMFLIGLATSAEILVFAVARDIFAKRLAGSAIALTNMMVMLSGMIAQPLVGKLLDTHWVTHSTLVEGIRVYTKDDYTFAMMLIPVAFALAVVLSFFMKESYKRNGI